MEYLRIYASDDGESHLEMLELPTPTTSFLPSAAPFGVSAPYAAESILFVEFPPELATATPGEQEALLGWQTAPQRMLVVLLEGAIEIRSSDGDAKTVRAGQFILAEDTHGKGHLTIALDGVRRAAFVPLPREP